MPDKGGQTPVDRANDPSRVVFAMRQRPNSPMEAGVEEVNSMAVGLPSFKYHSTSEMNDLRGYASDSISPGFSFSPEEFKEKHRRSHREVAAQVMDKIAEPGIRAEEAKAAAKAPKVKVKKNG